MKITSNDQALGDVMKPFNNPNEVNFTDFSLVEVRSKDAENKGVFAKRFIKRGAFIGCYAGRVVVVEIDPQKKKYINTELEHRQILQLFAGDRHVVGLVAISGFKGVDYINHSCRANVTVQDRVLVFAKEDIPEDQEITIDYREWDFIPEGISCWCEEAKCQI